MPEDNSVTFKRHSKKGKVSQRFYIYPQYKSCRQTFMKTLESSKDSRCQGIMSSSEKIKVKFVLNNQKD